MTSLREDIEQTIIENRKLEKSSEGISYAIIGLFKERIDELKKNHPRDLYGAYNAGLDDVMDMLK